MILNMRFDARMLYDVNYEIAHCWHCLVDVIGRQELSEVSEDVKDVIQKSKDLIQKILGCYSVNVIDWEQQMNYFQIQKVFPVLHNVKFQTNNKILNV